MAGYYSGLLKGMLGKAEIERSQTLNEATRLGLDQTRQQMAIQAEDQDMQRQAFPEKLRALQIGTEGSELELGMAKEAYARKQYENNLLRKMISENTAYKANADQVTDYEGLAESNRKMGRALQSTDPTAAKKYFDMADGYDTQAMQKTKNTLEIRAKQADVVGQTLLNVKSQEDFNEAVPVLAANGIAVPPELRDWNNPATRDFVQKVALRSPTLAKNYQEEIGYLGTIEKQYYDRQNKKILDQEKYDQSLAEKLAQAGVAGKANASSLGKIGAYEGLYNEAFVGNANEILPAAQSLSAISNGFGDIVQAGPFANLKGDGLINASQKYLSNKITPEEAQQYEAIVAPIVRQYGVLLNFGRPVTTIQQQEMLKKSLMVEAGQPRIVFLQKIGDMRTAYEKAVEAKLASPTFKKPGTEDQKAKLEENLELMKQTIPFTANDVANYTAASKKEPNLTFENFLEKKGVKLNKDTSSGLVPTDRMNQFKVLR